MITSSIIHSLMDRGVGLWQISIFLDRLWATNMASNSSRKSKKSLAGRTDALKQAPPKVGQRNPHPYETAANGFS